MAALENSAQKSTRMLLAQHVPNVKVCIGPAPAYDGANKRLYLPAYSKESSDSRLEMAWRGLQDHEISHAINSDFDVLRVANDRWKREHGPEAAQRLFQLLNVYEDVWIEPAIAQIYPGAKMHLQMKNDYLIEKTGGAAPTDPEYRPTDPKTGRQGAPMGVFGAMGQAILRCGRRAIDLDDVHPDIQKLMVECETEITEGWAATSTIEAIDAAERTYAKLQSMANSGGEEEDDDDDDGGAPSPGDDGDSDGGGGAAGPPGEGAPGDEEGNSGDEGKSEEGDPDNDDGSGGKPEAGDDEGDGAGSSAGEGEGEGEEEGSPGDSEGKGPDCDGDAQAGSEPNGEGAGACDHETRALAAEAAGGDYGEMPSDADVIASRYIREMPPLYTVYPESAECDVVVEYGPELRAAGRDKLEQLKAAAGPAMKKLTSMMRGAIQASRQSLVVGGMEEGDGLDMDALPGIAMGFNDPAIFTSTMRKIDESTFVQIEVDCSGSMGSSKPEMVNGKLTATSKAAYAAITAMALHRALQGCRVPHAVTGYNTHSGSYAPSGTRDDGYQLWSRSHRAMRNHIFVPAPGLHDDGAALPYITGGGCNLDGESIEWAAKYAAQHGGNYDRVILLVIADGLPAGADDGRIEGPYLKQQVEAIAQAQIEVYGIGVGIRDWSVFSSYYPDNKGGNGRSPTGAVQIKSGEGLTDGVLRQLTALLTRGYGMTRKGR